MHRCLLVDELVLHIIGFLWDDSGINRSRYYTDVARLARTCQSLMDPSLDVLWRTQPALSPLVMCLHEDFWEKSPRSLNTIVFKKTPLPEDWTRLRRYSRRIQRISYPMMPFSLPKLEVNILEAMFAPGIFGHLFPSLCTLNFSLFFAATPLLDLLGGLLSSHITDLSFTLPNNANEDTLRNLLDVILRTAGSLETLRVSSSVSPSPEMNFMEQDFPCLRDLSISGHILLSSQSLRRLATLRYLQELNLRLSSNFDSVLVHSAPRAFSALQQVTIHAHTLPHCTAFLSCITSASLKAVTFSYDTHAEPTFLTAFLRQVQLTCTRAPMFHTLVLQNKIQRDSTSDPPFTFHSSALAPLLSCRGLRVLKLIHLGFLDLDGAFIAEAKCAWPELEELDPCGQPMTNMQRTTLISIRGHTRD